MFQILCVEREIYCSGPMQSLDANTAKHWVKLWNCAVFIVFYGILKKDFWGAYEWTWDIFDFFVKSIHCPL